MTTLHNAAREPEIVDLCDMLNGMGAQVEGAGTSKIVITGVDKLHPIEHEVIGDRIVAGTWAYAAAMTQGDITVGGIAPKHLHLPLEKLRSAGAEIESYENGFRVRMTSARSLSTTKPCRFLASRQTCSRWQLAFPRLPTACL